MNFFSTITTKIKDFIENTRNKVNAKHAEVEKYFEENSKLEREELQHKFRHSKNRLEKMAMAKIMQEKGWMMHRK